MALPDWADTISERIKVILKTYPEIFIFAFVSIGVVGFFSFLKSKNDNHVVTIEKHYTHADTIIQSKLKEKSAIDSISLCKNLKTVYFYINDIKQSKLYLATTYQRFLIGCYTIGLFFIVLTAVITFVVTKKGWDNSNRKRKGLLLTCVFYGILLPLYPKLFDQDQNYKNNFSDYTALSKSQLYIYSRLNPYFGKLDNKLDGKDSTKLIEAMDTVTSVIMQHLNIDISIDQKQLEVKTIDIK
jgi:hypothetical protein